MATNKYFNQTRNVPEQDLYSDLLIEQIQIYGMDVVYIKRENLDIDKILNEPTMSKFKESYVIEMYMPDSEQAQGEQYYMSRLGIDFSETSELYVSTLRWKEVVGDNMVRPREGDLIYVGNPNSTYSSTINKMYKIKNVTMGHPERAQFGKNHSYRIIAETFIPSYEEFDTEYDDIDSNYNTDIKEEFLNTINDASVEEAKKVMVQTENPFGEDYKNNKPNNPFGDIF